jgi:hypothetical protein
MNVGDLWYLCGNYGYNEAADACAGFGWRMVMVTDSNRPDVEALVQSCQGPDDFRAWVAGADGMVGDPCAYVLNYGGYMGIIFSVGTEVCSNFFIGVVCQEIPKITNVVTNTITTLVQFSGVTTQTVTSLASITLVDDSDLPNLPDSSLSTSNKNPWKTIDIETGPFDPPCLGTDCVPVCHARAEGIRILRTRVNAKQAAQECQKYGWSLLDLTYGREPALLMLLKECGSDFPVGYVNSLNGLSSNCTSAQLIDVEQIEGIAVGIPVNEKWCSTDADFLPICQVQPPIRTGKGVETGQLSITITTTTTVVTAVLPSTTSTTTIICTEYVRNDRSLKAPT